MTVEHSAAFQAERVAVLYRRIVLLVGAQILFSFLSRLAKAVAAPLELALALVSLLVLVGALAMGVATAVFTYQLMREFGSPVPWLWAIGMFVPCLNIVLLLVVSARSQAWCKERGIRVGFLGPTPDSIAELKRRSLVDRTFE